jgi:hypothetical protein
MEAVEKPFEDVPYDFENPLYYVWTPIELLTGSVVSTKLKHYALSILLLGRKYTGLRFRMPACSANRKFASVEK